MQHRFDLGSCQNSEAHAQNNQSGVAKGSTKLCSREITLAFGKEAKSGIITGTRQFGFIVFADERKSA